MTKTTKELGLTVTYIGGYGTIRMTPTNRFMWVMPDGSVQRLDGVIFSRNTGEFRLDFWRQTKTGQDYKRACGKVLASVELPEDLAVIVWDAIVPALREAYRVPAGCVVTEEGFDSTEVPENERPSYGVHYIQVGPQEARSRWFQTSEGRAWWIKQMADWIKVTELVDPQPERKRISDKTLDDFDGTLSTRENAGLSWMVQSDLAHDLSQLAHTLDSDAARKLIAAVCAGLPIKLTWDTPFGEDRIERRTTVTLVEYLSAPHSTNGALPGKIRVHYWGFTHDVWMDRIVEVDTPGTTSVYLDR